MLTPLQRQIVEIVQRLPEAEGFALAGGAALIVRGLVQRETHDLDYFATRQEAVARLAPALERRLEEAEFTVERIQDSPGFVRFHVSSEDEACEVDLAHDVRLRTPVMTSVGPVLADDELAADKMLALFGRARGRDFVDVHALLNRYAPSALMELAASKDPGFTPGRFAEALDAIDRLPRDDFPVDDAMLDALRRRFDAWARSLRRHRDPPHPERGIDGRDLGPPPP